MMLKTENTHNMEIIPLTKKLAEKYWQDICVALDQIPLVDKHTKEQLLAESKGDRFFHNKWAHSLIAFDESDFVGVIIGFEREKEDNDQYPYNSVYLSDFAVSSDYQKKGIGRQLVKDWIEFNRDIGSMLTLSGELKFSIQTNAADSNLHVQRLYESFGFKKTAEKQYDNRLDNVYFLG